MEKLDAGLTSNQRRAAIRAHERRYGQSMLPYRFRQGADHWRITDDENDTFTVFGFRTSGRLYVNYSEDARS